MIEIASVVQDGLLLNIFLQDKESGYTAKDVMTIPGVYEELKDKTDGLKLVQFESMSVSGWGPIKCFALVVSPSVAATNLIDYAAQLGQLLRMPSTAMDVVIKSYPEEIRGSMHKAVQTMEFYKSVTTDSNICLPEEALNYLDEETRTKMKSKMVNYALKSVDNQEIVQRDPRSEWGVTLPSIDLLHSGGATEYVGTLDLIRACAPYRKGTTGAVVRYNSIYHTPYFKIDPQLRGVVPQHLGWINGSTSNDLLDIQPNERHMLKNLTSLVCEDVRRFTAELLTGIFLTTPFGDSIRAIAVCQDPSLLPDLLANAYTLLPEGCTTTLSTSETDGLTTSMGRDSVIPDKVTISEEVYEAAVQKAASNHRFIIDVNTLPFIFKFDDATLSRWTEEFIKIGFVTKTMSDFLIQLACDAYTVSWGHTGVTRATPHLLLPQDAPGFDEAMSVFLSEKLSKTMTSGVNQITQQTRVLYELNDDTDDDDDSAEQQEETIKFDYFIAPETQSRIASGNLPADYFVSKATGAEGLAASTVERWRIVNGDNGLRFFLGQAYLQSGDISVLLHSIVKLMRWGDMRPKCLVLTNHPEIRTIFDLGTGEEKENIALLEDSQIIRNNGCRASIDKALTEGANANIVGFVLRIDYGSCQKRVLASWGDLAELAEDPEEIAEFTRVCPLNFSGNSATPITSFHELDYDLATPPSKLKAALEVHCQPRELSDLALLSTPGILTSADYMRSLRTEVLLTTRDRQFDILRRYVEKVALFYQRYGTELGKIQTSADLKDLAMKFKTIASPSEKQDANTANASTTLKGLNLSSIAYAEGDLSGKFRLITDKEGMSGIEPMDFSDPRIQRLISSSGTQVPFLLMERGVDELWFCRKDLTANELIVNPETKVIATHKYDKIAPVFEALLGGEIKHLVLGGTRRQCRIHNSLQDYILRKRG